MEKQAAFEKIAQVRAKLMLQGAYEAGVRDGMAKQAEGGGWLDGSKERAEDNLRHNWNWMTGKDIFDKDKGVLEWLKNNPISQGIRTTTAGDVALGGGVVAGGYGIHKLIQALKKRKSPRGVIMTLGGPSAAGVQWDKMKVTK